jgi:hypothetical protein
MNHLPIERAAKLLDASAPSVIARLREVAAEQFLQLTRRQRSHEVARLAVPM